MTSTAQRTQASARGGNTLIGLIRGMRPRQWVKNVLVAAAPFAGGVIAHVSVLAAVGLAFVAFSLAASGVYLVNDVLVLQG
jgi:decaprenyl-phosphate phosphoribosyltransferase